MISGGGGGGGNLQVDGTSCALRRTPVRTESIAGLYIFLRGLLRVWCASEKKTIYDSAPNPESEVFMKVLILMSTRLLEYSYS